MKKLILVLAIVSLTFASCVKQKNVEGKSCGVDSTCVKVDSAKVACVEVDSVKVDTVK